MAKVISWRITNGGDELFAYIASTGSTDSPRIETKKLSQKEANRIGLIVADWPEDEYTRHFEAMKNLISQEVGWSIDIGDASKYYNVLGNGEVLMLVGADGKNLADQTNPFYSFHLSNQSIAIGTGEDYKLDLNAIIEGNAFFERDGVKYSCNGGITVQSSSDIQNYFQISYESGTESSDFKLTIKKGLQFPKYDAHMIEILIVGRRADGFEAKAVLTIAAVLGGKEGVSYDLVVSPKQFHYASLADATNRGNNDKATVGVLRNGKRLSSQEMTEENLRVGYEYDPDGSNGLDVDVEDITYVQLTSEGTYEVPSSTIMNHGGSVSFYLISNGQYIDTDSASVVVDGVDGQDGAGVISLELENEFEAIGVGDDSKIDISGEGGVTAQTNVRVYSGETSLVIDKIKIASSSISAVNNGLWQDISEAKKQDSNGEHYGTIKITLRNGFEFGSDLRDKLSVTLTALTSSGSIERHCNFTLLGVKGGKEGIVYRIEPSDDAIMYDPNANLVKFGGIETAIPVSELTDSHTITASAKAGMHTKTDTEIVNDNEYISYSIGQTFSTAGAVITPTTPHINNKVKISDILGVSDPSSRFVTFYWIKKVGEEYYMLDRETVPVISDGRDGEGGLVVDIDPKFINVATDEIKTILTDTNINVRVGFMSGSTIVDSSVALSVTQNLQSGSITRTGYKVGDDKYHEVTLTLNKGGVFSQDGMAAVKFICKSGEEERAATFYIYSSTGGKGDKGDKGPQTRLRDWSAEHANGKGSGYQAGGENDDYVDIVWHRNKYYLCKKTHDPIETSASGQGNEPGLTGEAEWEKYWEEYDAQPFTASKIATFGVWPNGWVIDKGKIQHTLSAITLDADGEINVQSPAELLYEYNGSNGTTIYATRDYEDPNIRALYSGNSVPVYVDSGYKALNNTAYILGNDGKISLSGRQTISIRTYRVAENYILPGYSLSDILEKDLTIKLIVAERELSFKNRYTYSETGDAVFTSGSGTCRQVVYTYTDVIEAGDIDSTDFYSIPKHQTVESSVTYQHTYISSTEVTIEELKSYQWPDEPTFVSFSSPRQILLGSSAIATTTQTVGNDSDLVREGEFVPSFSYDNDIITCPSDSNYYSGSTSSDEALFTEETGSTSTRVVKDLSMDKNSSVTSSTIGDSYFVYFDRTSFETAYNNKGINIETLANIVGDYIDDGSDLVLYNRTARPAFSKQDEDGISTKINATKERVSVEDGRIMLAAGINNNANYIYKWKHDDSNVIYEIYGYKENFKSFEHGQTVLIYTTNETNGTQIPVSATIYKTGTITGISYNGTIYYYAEAIQLTEPVQFAATRIFENGKIVTNGLHAHNGVFNGRIEATSGTFSGEINAEGGNIRNVSIENADINGNLNIRNGKSLTIYNTNSEPSVTLSSAKIDGARNTKNVPFGSVSFYDTRKGWGTKTVLIEKVVVPKGYKLKIPKFRVRTTSFTRVGDRSVFSMYYQTGTTRTYIQGANNTSISKSSNFTTPSTVFTANQDAILSLYATFSYELKGDAWIFSDSKIGLSVTPEENGEITYTNTTVTISKSEIGTNGFVFANKNGSRISMVTGDDGNTNIDILVNGGLGFSIDSNKFAIIYGNYSYNLKDILNKLTELGVTPEQV